MSRFGGENKLIVAAYRGIAGKGKAAGLTIAEGRAIKAESSVMTGSLTLLK